MGPRRAESHTLQGMSETDDMLHNVTRRVYHEYGRTRAQSDDRPDEAVEGGLRRRVDIQSELAL